jgi:hypothetical protein
MKPRKKEKKEKERKKVENQRIKWERCWTNKQ